MWKQVTKEKKSRDISTRLISLTTMCLLVCACMVSAAKGQNTTTAEQLFQKGLEAYKGNKWEEAAGHFHAAYRRLPHSQISYCLSCCYHRLKDAEKALEFANKALKDKPTLKKPYSTAARKIQDYAAYVLKERRKDPDFIYMIESSIDYPGRVGPIPPIPQKMTDGQLPPTPKTRSLTGTWKSNQGATYFIRQIGNVIWWYGESTDSGKQWTNVFRGTIAGNRIKGTWADVPKGRLANSGVLELQIEESGRLTRKKGNFGDTYWMRYTPKIIKKPVIKPKPVKKPKPVIKPKKFTPTRR
jgi:hypothetical protein